MLLLKVELTILVMTLLCELWRMVQWLFMFRSMSGEFFSSFSRGLRVLDSAKWPVVESIEELDWDWKFHACTSSIDTKPTLIDSKHSCCQRLMTVRLLPQTADLLRQPQSCRLYWPFLSSWYCITHALLGLCGKAFIHNNEWPFSECMYYVDWQFFRNIACWPL